MKIKTSKIWILPQCNQKYFNKMTMPCVSKDVQQWEFTVATGKCVNLHNETEQIHTLLPRNSLLEILQNLGKLLITDIHRNVQSYTLYNIQMFSSVQFTQSCSTLCDPMDCCVLGLPVHHQLPEVTQIHVH